MESLDFSKSLSPLYGYDAVQDQMRTAFKKSKPSVLLLPDFLTTRSCTSLARSLDVLKGSVAFSAERHSFTNVPLTQAHRGFFASPAFFDFVRVASGINVRDVRLGAMRFGHRDFTLLHDDQLSDERFVFFYTQVSPRWKSNFGGSIIFSFGDEREPLIFEPKHNTLVLFKVPKGMRDFVKYVNHYAGDESLTYLFGEFLIR